MERSVLVRFQSWAFRFDLICCKQRDLYFIPQKNVSVLAIESKICANSAGQISPAFIIGFFLVPNALAVAVCVASKQYFLTGQKNCRRFNGDTKAIYAK